MRANRGAVDEEQDGFLEGDDETVGAEEVWRVRTPVGTSFAIGRRRSAGWVISEVETRPRQLNRYATTLGCIGRTRAAGVAN